MVFETTCFDRDLQTCVSVCLKTGVYCDIGNDRNTRFAVTSFVTYPGGMSNSCDRKTGVSPLLESGCFRWCENGHKFCKV